jgi:hypothetical protein
VVIINKRRQQICKDEGDRWKELLYTVDGNANYSTLWKAVWRLLKKLKIKLLFDPAIALLDIDPNT